MTRTSDKVGMILIEDGKVKWYINVAEIVFALADRNYTTICVFGEKPRLCSIQLGQLMDKIEDVATYEACNLKRVGRSLIVNTTYIDMIDFKKSIIILDNDAKTELKCSRNALSTLFTSMKKKNSLLRQESVKYRLKAHSEEELSDEILEIEGAECVDLGLPSGLKWATRNLDCGLRLFPSFFAWGETEVRRNCDMNTSYIFGETEMTKYNSQDGLTTLLPEDDAATCILGGRWRIPTKEEFDELKDYCEWVWCTWGIVTGCLVTGPNNNSIFLEADGYHIKGYGFEEFRQGNYWTSTLDEKDNTLAYTCIFGEGFDGEDVHFYDESLGSRRFGYSIRPVID